MKKFYTYMAVATLLATFCASNVDAWVEPPLSEEARCVLHDISCCGRSALVWFDTEGHTHISVVNDGIDLRTVMNGEYTGCTCEGAPITICKRCCDFITFNGVEVAIHPIDCHDRHLFIVPVCS